jgi:hypothetical protein
MPRASSSLLRRDTSGSRNASDFPEPVSAHRSTLSPASDTGSDAFWMAVGVWIFIAASARHSSTDSPICAGEDAYPEGVC